MPGVPYEMQEMMTQEILPRLQQLYTTPHIAHRHIRTHGIGESYLSEILEAWEDALPDYIKLAYLPSPNEVKLRLTGIHKDLLNINKALDNEVSKLILLIPQYITSTSDEGIEIILGNLLREKNLTIAVAESCTGGYIAHLLTMHSGSSDYMQGGIVAYSNEAKINILNVSRDTIDSHGAVSAECVAEMATSVKELFRADIGISISGIAGPTGGTQSKPVGTVWTAISSSAYSDTHLHQLSAIRSANIRAASVALMERLYKQLSKA